MYFCIPLCEALPSQEIDKSLFTSSIDPSKTLAPASVFSWVSCKYCFVSSNVPMLLYKTVSKRNGFLPSIKDEWVGKYCDNDDRNFHSSPFILWQCMDAQRKYHPNPRPSCQNADGLSSPGFDTSLTISSPAFSRHEC